MHVNRLKPAYVREPTPNPYFKEAGQIRIDSSVHMTEQATQTSNITNENITDNAIVSDTSCSSNPTEVTQSRPKRTLRKPIRYCDGADTSDVKSSDKNRKIRIIAQRTYGPNIEYLVKTVGDPSEHSVWLPQSKLNAVAKRYVQLNPPPCV